MWFSCRKPCSRNDGVVFSTPASRSTAATSSREAESRPGLGWVQLCLAFLLAYTTWAWAGLRPSFHWVGVGAAGVLLAGAVWHAPRAVARDPVFYLGLAFLGLLAIQWANAGRYQYFDVGYQRWMFTPPPWRNWPSAFDRQEALQMLNWFFPAWVLLLALRAPAWPRRHLRRFLLFLAFNAGLLAIFGLVQFLSGTRAIYWIQPLKGDFFASFAYGNHVAPYFLLTGSLAAGLLFAELLDGHDHETGSHAKRLRHPVRVAALAVTFLLCLLAAVLGFSRAGVILAGASVVFIAGYGWMRGWPLWSAPERVKFSALTVAALVALLAVAVDLGAHGIKKQFTPAKAPPGMGDTTRERIDLELGGRPRYARAAVAVWLEQPWFGVGGWGFKYRVADYIPPEAWKGLMTDGRANVHVDFLQFLAEFGVVGAGLMAGIVVGMLPAWFRPGVKRRALWLLGGWGLGLTVVFSLVDIPFRSPAILYTWLAILAAVPPACRSRALNGFESLPVRPPERFCP